MSQPSPNGGQGYSGFQQSGSASSDRNAQTFFVWSILARVRTMTLVQVMGVTNAGGISPVGFVDLLPLVNQIDGSGNAVPHGTIYQCPYFRLQGGANAIIIDPQVGDIGWAGFADRDISSVIANKGQANPGSRRQFDMADAVYFGGMLNGTPTQYIAFSASGIALVSPTKVTITAPITEIDSTTSFTVNAPQIIMNGTLTQGGGSYAGTATYNGNFTVNGVLTNNGHAVGSTHTHTGVQTGTGTSGPPT